MRKYCWKCKKISKFALTDIPYVAKITGGTNYNCIKCENKWKKENNIVSVERISTPENLFSCDYKFITKP